MTQKEKTACMILMQGLVNIRDKKCGALFRVPEYAKAVLNAANDALTKEDEPKKPDQMLTLGTDAMSVTHDFMLAKRFVEQFIQKEEEAELVIITDYKDSVDDNKILYELTVKKEEKNGEMLDWLYENNYSSYTLSNNEIVLYFEIVATIGTETAYLVECNKPRIKRIK